MLPATRLRMAAPSGGPSPAAAGWLSRNQCGAAMFGCLVPRPIGACVGRVDVPRFEQCRGAFLAPLTGSVVVALARAALGDLLAPHYANIANAAFEWRFGRVSSFPLSEREYARAFRGREQRCREDRFN